MNYTIDREEGAELLGMSTRTVDRYIRAGKIRSKKMGKKVFLHQEDVERISKGGIQEDYQILSSDEVFAKKSIKEEAPVVEKEATTSSVPSRVNNQELMKIYQEFQGLITQKDAAIREVSYKLGQAEEALKNSMPLTEHKKTTFLLEASKMQLQEEKKVLDYKVKDLEQKIKKEQTGNLILTVSVVLLLIGVFLVWVMSGK